MYISHLVLFVCAGVYYNSFDNGEVGTQFIADATPEGYTWSFGNNRDTVNYGQPDNYSDAYVDSFDP
jgi:hypothetical protein